jgi:hypothetical protein
MRNDDSFEPEVDALHALPRKVDPGQVLEERTVRALRQRNLLQGAHRRTAWQRWAWAAAVVLALALFSAGFLLGRSGAKPGTPAGNGVAREAKPARDSGVAGRQKATGRDVTVATDMQQQPPAGASERYVVWF